MPIVRSIVSGDNPMIQGNVYRNGSAFSVKFLRKSCLEFYALQEFVTAEFWADKAVTVGNGNQVDYFLLARCVFGQGQYHRCMHMIEAQGLAEVSILAACIASKCRVAMGDLDSAMLIMRGVLAADEVPGEILMTRAVLKSLDKNLMELLGLSEETIISHCHFTAGSIAQSLDQLKRSRDQYANALKANVRHYEALQRLVNQGHLGFSQSSTDETTKESTDDQGTMEVGDAFLANLDFQWQVGNRDAGQLLQRLYSVLGRQTSSGIGSGNFDGEDIESDKDLQIFANSHCVLIARARQLQMRGMNHEAHAITSQVLDEDPYNEECLPIHLVCLVSLQKSNELYIMGQNLVNTCPDKAVAWFGVACFYYSERDYTKARMYFSKATLLEPQYAAAWIGFGHSFAAEHNHDQAITAYGTAARYYYRIHWPYLFTGVEYMRSNNLQMAQLFYAKAAIDGGNDPVLLHEQGVVAYLMNDFRTAHKFFSQACDGFVEQGNGKLTAVAEPSLTNLGHTRRKLKMYKDAVNTYKKAIFLSPQCVPILLGLGYTKHLIGAQSEAISYYHEALRVNPNHSVAATLLHLAVHEGLDTEDVMK